MTMAVSDIETQDLLKSIDAKLGSIVTIMAKNANVTENRKSSKIEQDPHAEQRKWIGKLCMFWDEALDEKVWGILGGINYSENTKYPYWCDQLQEQYQCCEPVKLDDDIIYRGE